MVVGIGSPDGNSPKGLTTIAKGIAVSLAIESVLGTRSHVKRINDLSVQTLSFTSPTN